MFRTQPSTAYLLSAIIAVLAISLGFVLTGEVPEFILKVGHPTSVVFALDLSLVVPFLILGAIWLWKRQPWGYVLAAMLGVKGAVYMLALTAVSASMARSGSPQDLAQLPLWGLLGLGFLAASLALLGNVQPDREVGRHP